MINDTNDTNDADFSSSELYSAKLLLAFTLRQSHGIVFAGAFLDEFSTEIERAMSRARSGMLRSAR